MTWLASAAYRFTQFWSRRFALTIFINKEARTLIKIREKPAERQHMLTSVDVLFNYFPTHLACPSLRRTSAPNTHHHSITAVSTEKSQPTISTPSRSLATIQTQSYSARISDALSRTRWSGEILIIPFNNCVELWFQCLYSAVKTWVTIPGTPYEMIVDMIETEYVGRDCALTTCGHAEEANRQRKRFECSSCGN
jgi:hypothetical protein